jgi:hypothetical protein
MGIRIFSILNASSNPQSLGVGEISVLALLSFKASVSSTFEGNGDFKS